jgi:hypothetical protein
MPLRQVAEQGTVLPPQVGRPVHRIAHRCAGQSVGWSFRIVPLRADLSNSTLGYPRKFLECGHADRFVAAERNRDSLRHWCR